jgi:hypothetical protein
MLLTAAAAAWCSLCRQGSQGCHQLTGLSSAHRADDQRSVFSTEHAALVISCTQLQHFQQAGVRQRYQRAVSWLLV